MGMYSSALVLAGPCGTGWARGQGTLPGTTGAQPGTGVLGLAGDEWPLLGRSPATSPTVLVQGKGGHDSPPSPVCSAIALAEEKTPQGSAAAG